LIELDDYQEVAVRYLKDEPGETKFLFDEYGVGKTFPAIRAAWHVAYGTGRRILVTAPAYLLPQWKEAILAMYPTAVVQIVDADGIAARTEQFRATAHFVLTSYHNWANWQTKKVKSQTLLLKPNYPELLNGNWAVYVFDEGHRLRGRNSMWTQAVHKVRNSEMRNKHVPMWFLTGTPIVRDAGDLWPLLYLRDRLLYRGYWAFVERWCEIEEDPWEKKVKGILDHEKFGRFMSKISLMRKAKDIPQLAQLEHIDHDHWVTLPASVYKMFAKARKEYILEHPDMETVDLDSIGAVFQKLHMLTTVPPTQANPKIDTLMEWMEDHRGRLVIFCWYRSSVQEIIARLEKRGYKHVFPFTGDQSDKLKATALAGYNEHDDGIIVATISALKEGANLQKGNNVVFLEESVLPGDNEQCIARVKRRGQTETVHVTRILAKRSPDEVDHKHAGERAEDIAAARQHWLVTFK